MRVNNTKLFIIENKIKYNTIKCEENIQSKNRTQWLYNKTNIMGYN